MSEATVVSRRTSGITIDAVSMDHGNVEEVISLEADIELLKIQGAIECEKVAFVPHSEPCAMTNGWIALNQTTRLGTALSHLVH